MITCTLATRLTVVSRKNVDPRQGKVSRRPTHHYGVPAILKVLKLDPHAIGQLVHFQVGFAGLERLVDGAEALQLTSSLGLREAVPDQSRHIHGPLVAPCQRADATRPDDKTLTVDLGRLGAARAAVDELPRTLGNGDPGMLVLLRSSSAAVAAPAGEEAHLILAERIGHAPVVTADLDPHPTKGLE